MFLKKKEIEEFDFNATGITEITLDKANFIYKEVRDYLDATIDSLNKLEKKCTLLLIFIFSFCSFVFLNNSDLNEDFRTFLFALSAIYLLIAFLLVLLVYLPEEKRVPGNEPRNLLIQDRIDNELPMMILTEASIYQYYIDTNIEISTKRGEVLKHSMLVLILSPLLLYIGIAVFRFFSEPKICSF